MADGDQVRVGIIGCGGMADAHLPGLRKMEDVTVVGYCDVAAERATATAEKYGGGPTFTDPAALIAETSPDIVYILLPPFAHGPAERAALSAGVPFFCEKPAGNDLGVLREIAQEVRTKGLLTAVGYMNRYRESVRRAKEVFSSDTPILGYGGWIGGPPRGRSDKPIFSWWVVKEKSGGQMVEQVTHTVDLIRYLMGDVVEVFAHAATGFNTRLPDLAPGYSIEDAMMLNLRFESGAIGALWSSCSTPAGGGVVLDVYAAQHTAKFTGWEHSLRLLTAGEKEAEEVKGEGDIFAIEDRAVIDAVKSGDKSLIGTDYLDAVKTAEVTLIADESLRTGRPVEVGR